MTSPLGNWFFNELESPKSPSDYPKNWKDISSAFREKCKYKCADCGVDCSAHSRLLDVHHLNGVKNNCRPENLRCLCKDCHAKQDFHSHYKVKLDDKRLLSELRRKQGLKG